ncbi:MAG: hypothetical protein WKF84_14650 [Pyrinomonadaceae bacterium]
MVSEWRIFNARNLLLRVPDVARLATFLVRLPTQNQDCFSRWRNISYSLEIAKNHFMNQLHPNLRNRLEETVLDARGVAETGARAALERLAVGAAEPFKEMSADERSLRNRLRAHGRQLGDVLDAKMSTQKIDRLTAELSYEY